jgi:hypothetical protein
MYIILIILIYQLNWWPPALDTRMNLEKWNTFLKSSSLFIQVYLNNKYSDTDSIVVIQ